MAILELNQDRLLTKPREIDRNWLEPILRRNGLLTGGNLTNFEIAEDSGNWSHTARLTLCYSAEARGPRPASLFLKICRLQAGFGPSEVYYYTRDYCNVADAPLVPCYSAAYSAKRGYYHLLMADLTATHSICWDRPIDLAFGLAAAEALAALHAPYWTAARRTPVGVAQPGPVEVNRYIEHIRPGLEPLLANAAPDVKPDQLEFLPQLFEWYPRLLLERCRQESGFTLVHGDANLGNILAPREGGPRPLYLIDRQPFDWSLTTWLGVSDLTYLLITWLEPELRRQLEIPTLRHYHDQLAARGITDYSWEQLWDDYRLCAIQILYIPVQWCRDKEDMERMRWVWIPQLKRALQAFTDLDCAGLSRDQALGARKPNS